MKRAIAVVTSSIVMAGCSGVVPMPPAPSRATASVASAQQASLTIRIRVPKHHTGLQRHYISAGTKGMKFAFTGPSAITAVANLTPSSPSCTGKPLQCTIVVHLKSGTYHVTVDAYDQPPSGGSIPSGANLLSSASNVFASVKAGKANKLSITLDGVPASIDVSTLSAGTFGTPMSSGIGIAPVDADGYTIVGTFATPVNVSTDGAAKIISIATSGSDHPPAQTLLSSSDTATFSYDGSATGLVTITASAGSVNGSSVFRVHDPAFVADYGNQAVKEIPPGCSSSSCVRTISSGPVSGLSSVGVSRFGNVYYTDTTTGDAEILVPCSTGYCLAGAVASGFSAPKGVATDPEAEFLYVTGGANVYEMFVDSCNTASCAGTVGPGGFANPYQIAVDSSFEVYVADPTLGEVLKAPSGCTKPSCVVSLGGAGTFNTPQGVAIDNGGNVYVADSFGSVYEMPNTCTSSACVTSLGGGFLQPGSVAVDDFGDVIVADYGNNSVYSIPPGCATAVCVSKIGGGFGQLTGVAVP
jgi:hypothetical protein